MKIGILTQPLYNNYGGLLQNYALQQILINLGHEPITLDWGFKPKSYIQWCKSYYKALILYYIKGTKKPKYTGTPKEQAEIFRNNSQFIEKYLYHTNKLTSDAEFLSATQSLSLNALIVGSDQCWRPLYTGEMLYRMFLSFAVNLNIKRIAYAASFGTDEWEYTEEQQKCCSLLAKKFDVITTRESSGIELCKNKLGVDAYHVLDPTMLLERSCYEKIIYENNASKSIGNLFYYILDPSNETISFIDRLEKIVGLKKFTQMPKYGESRTKKNIQRELNECVYPGVIPWLRGFLDAEMVICDSFHGTVFSIIFNKPFWVLRNKLRGNARILSLLQTFGLTDRLVITEDFGNIDFRKQINWDDVNNILTERREYSISLIKQYLL